MKIFVFVYIRRWGGLVAQGIRGSTVPVWGPKTGTVLRGEYGGRLSKMAGNRKNMSNIAKVKFLFAGNI